MNNEKQLIMALIVLIAMLAVLLGASGRFENTRPEQTSEEESALVDEDLIVVGFSQLGSESVWRTTHTQSIQDALSKENGFFLQYSNARQKQENQIKAIRGFISQRVDYIVFSPLMEDGWETVLTEAKEAGIPVILVDRKVSGSSDLYTTFIGSDMEEEGRKAGEWLASYQKQIGHANDPINIVVLTGTFGSSSQIGRSRGFEQVAAEHPNWHILARESGDFTVIKGKEAMAKLLRMYDDIDVVVSQNDEMTFGAMEAIAEAGYTTGIYGDMKLISFDGVKDALGLVDFGKINCDVECNPLQGELLAEVIHKLEAGEQVEKEYFVDELVFTRDNVREYLGDRVY
ncbi:MAG: ABC transporter substrate-binding protein [bacterium]|nr:ABC transporter substrate-binding protein [bacterium]MDY4099166.1 ABC transporter substrate-binding protein [Lachnospiraceae bacterium]